MSKPLTAKQINALPAGSVVRDKRRGLVVRSETDEQWDGWVDVTTTEGLNSSDLNAVLVARPFTDDAAEVATGLESIFDYCDPKMDGSMVVTLPKYHDRPGTVGVTLPPPTVGLIKRAAEILRGEA